MIAGRHRAQLNKAAQEVVRRVCQERLGSMTRPPIAEIEFVSSLIVNGADLLQTQWEPILAQENITIKVGGVFCHQSPMVEIKAKPPYFVPTLRCELADLLVLHSHSRSDGKVFQRGVLMPAKSDPGKSVNPDEPQLWLYRHWPNFVITSPGFDRRTRTFGGDQRSGRYALVSSKGWRVLPASDRLARNSLDGLDLSEFLVNMLYDMDPAQRNRTSAHGRQVYQNSKKDWSLTIRELLEVTGVRALRYKGLYASELSRLGGEVLQMISHVAIQRSLAPPDHGGVEMEEGGGEGISILVIATRSLDSPRPD